MPELPWLVMLGLCLMGVWRERTLRPARGEFFGGHGDWHFIPGVRKLWLRLNAQTNAVSKAAQPL